MTTQFKRIIKPLTGKAAQKFKVVKVSSKMMGEELAKSANEAVLEAKALTWESWYNSEPLIATYIDDEESLAYLFSISEDLEGKIILYDFFDMNLLHSHRSMSFISELHKRYNPAGLVIIGVHSPLFSFEKEKEYMSETIRRLGIQFPIVCDNDFSIWNCFENEAWPRRVLINSKNVLIMDMFEEGNYPTLEKTIQEQLRLISPGLACPPLLPEPYSPDTKGGEFLFGINHMAIFANGPEEPEPNQELLLTTISNAPVHVPWLVGKWVFHNESVYPTLATNKTYEGEHSLHFKTNAKSVWLVSAPKSKVVGNVPKPIKTIVTLNGDPVPEMFFGKDLQYSESRKTQLLLRGPRLRQVLNNLDGNTHELAFHVDHEGYDTVEFYGIFSKANLNLIC